MKRWGDTGLISNSRFTVRSGTVKPGAPRGYVNEGRPITKDHVDEAKSVLETFERRLTDNVFAALT